VATPLAPGSRIAHFVVVRPIGEGGMGTVYLAREQTLDRSVALKLLSPELARDEAFRSRFLEEMRLAASLDHPHVCPVYAAGEADGVLYLALRFVEGEDAARLVGRDGPLAPERAVSLLADLASALDHAHAHGLIHRDVKLENLLLDADGNAYLADFGVALPLRGGEATKPGELEGTLLYLAPERINGRDASPASDQYAFACLAYFLLSGVAPFVRSHEAALLFAHLRDEVPSLGEQGLARLDAVLQQALAKRPDERFPSCAAFVSALGKALARPEPSEAAWPESLPRARTSFLGRKRELNELEAIVSGGARLLTLTGPGGTGKTRLGLELAARLAPRYADGATWVRLADIAEATLLFPQIASAIGKPDVPALDAIADAELLLGLDNLEQLLPDAAASLASLVEQCPKLTLLCTSRSPLRHSTSRKRAPCSWSAQRSTASTSRPLSRHARSAYDSTACPSPSSSLRPA
jgi:protein kinase-like protein/AAA ATPase-like protein